MRRRRMFTMMLGATALLAVAGRRRGLWQINSGYWSAYSSYAQSTNAHGMYVISSHGTNWHPWVTYNNGAYKSYWSNACAAVKALCGASHAGC